MTALKLFGVEGKEISIKASEIETLRQNLRGSLITPGTETFDVSRKIWNAMIDRSPGCIVRCEGTSDVIHAVQFAQKHGLLTSIRGAGHNIAGKSLNEGGMLIDLSEMRFVHVNPSHRQVTAAPGATLGDLDAETQLHGLAVPVGINSTTGVAGLTLGGGFGWISRKYGLTIDNLAEVEVVTADGRCLQCDSHRHPELFWAVKGGGGNFGVVTLFKFHAHPVGPKVMSGPIVFPFDEAKRVLQNYREFCRTSSDELTVWALLRKAPPLPFLPEAFHGKLVLILVAMHCGALDRGESALEELKTLGIPVADGVAPHSYADFQRAFDPLLTPGARNYWKSQNFTELSDALIEGLVARAAELPSDESEIFIAQLGGKINRIAADATAYPHRDVEFVMNVHTRWREPKDDERCMRWARQLSSETEPFSTGGVYVNFISEGEERVKGAYGENYNRLLEIKRRYDPQNFWRINQNIVPSNDSTR
ncbi:MAG: FAD-binding oxidoreductase [Chlamydiia bacterium]|nr:FAD-binding oxidoreductase [Chlamydiia bacterium]